MTDIKEETINVLETLINIYSVSNEEGEPAAPMIDIVEAWTNANELLSKLKGY